MKKFNTVSNLLKQSKKLLIEISDCRNILNQKGNKITVTININQARKLEKIIKSIEDDGIWNE